MAERLALSDGGYVEWSYESNGATTGDPQGVLHVQKYAADGTPIGPDYSHSTLASNYGVYALQGGGFVVGLTTATMNGATLLAEVVDASGSLLKTINAGSAWSLASSPDGGFVVGSVSTVHHGFLPPDSRITLYDNQGNTVTSPAVSARSGPQITVDADGTYHASWTDGGGNPHNLAIDPEHPPTFTAPAAPRTISFYDDVGTKTGFNVSMNDPTPTIRVAVAEPGWVAIEALGTSTFGGSAPMNPGGFVEVTAEDVARGYKDLDVSAALRATGRTSLTDGNYEIGARFENADGIVGPLAQFPLHIDTQAPGQPTITKVIDDVGPTQGEVANGSTTDDTQLTFQIALPAGTVTSDKIGMIDSHGRVAWGVSITQADIDQGYVTTTMPVGAGPNHWTAQIMDSVENLGAASAAVEFNVDNGSSGRTITSQQYGDTLTGGGGNDTLVAGQGPDQLTGAGGGDVFAFRQLPWNSGHVTDFAVGSDKLDLSALFQASGYTGSDPIRDGYVSLENDGMGGAIVKYDTDGAASGNTIKTTLTTLDHVSWTATWAQLTGSGGGQSTVNISPGTVSHAEGDSGVTAFSFTLTRTGDLSQNATTNYKVVGTGDHPADPFDIQGYAGGGYGINWMAGESSKTITVNVNGDTQAEATETFKVVLTTPGAGNTNPTAIGPNGSAIGTIVDDDSAPPPATTIGFNPNFLVQAEGDSGATPFVFHLTRTGDVSGTSTVSYHVGGSGPYPVDENDFAGGAFPSGTVTFAAGETSKDLVINVAGDTTPEQKDGFAVVLDSVTGGALGSDYSTRSARGDIVDDDSSTPPPPSDQGRVINSTQYGDTLTGGSGNDTLNAGRGPDVLTGGGGGDVFAYHDLPWNAGRVTDFTVGSDRIDLSALFQASGYTGSDPIADGYVSLQADGTGGAYLLYDTDGRASGNTIQFRIADLEHVSPSATWAQLSGGGTSNPPPVGGEVNFATSSVSHAEGNSGLTAYSFTITRSGDVSQGATTAYRIVGSGAHPADAADVQGLGGGGTFAWSAGESSHVLTVNVVGDSSVESDETFSVVLATPGAGNSNPTPVGANGTAIGTIVNDDAPTAENGRVITSSQYGDTLSGGDANDTLNAGQGPDRLTGGGGADLFVFGKEPWNAGHVTDFTPGTDKLDLRSLFAHATYQGSDPVGAHVLEFRSDGAGNTQVYFDHDDPNGGDWPFLITTLDGVSPSQISSGDFIFH